MRAKHEIEDMGQNRQRIVVTEIPYMVNKANLVAKIAELVHDKRLEGITDIRDESDRNGMRIVIELRRDVSANVVLSYLYKHTQMQDTFGAIMLALVNGEPKILSLKSIIKHYVDHQKDVITRRTTRRAPSGAFMAKRALATSVAPPSSVISSAIRRSPGCVYRPVRYRMLMGEVTSSCFRPAFCIPPITF